MPDPAQWAAQDIAALLDAHLARCPAMTAQDAYKLLFQAVRGPEHLITSPEAFTARLKAEFEPVEADDSAPLWESIRPDGTLGRLNLRPFKARGGDPAELARLCLATAGQAWGTVGDLRAVWGAFVALCDQQRWAAFAPAEVAALAARLAAENFPALHHSGAYRAACRPAYRLLGKIYVRTYAVERPDSGPKPAVYTTNHDPTA